MYECKLIYPLHPSLPEFVFEWIFVASSHKLPSCLVNCPLTLVVASGWRLYRHQLRDRVSNTTFLSNPVFLSNLRAFKFLKLFESNLVKQIFVMSPRNLFYSQTDMRDNICLRISHFWVKRSPGVHLSGQVSFGADLVNFLYMITR